MESSVFSIVLGLILYQLNLLSPDLIRVSHTIAQLDTDSELKDDDALFHFHPWGQENDPTAHFRLNGDWTCMIYLYFSPNIVRNNFR